MIVVLPEPFGPSSPMISPARTENDDAVHGARRPEVLDEVRDLDHCGRVPGAIW